MWSDYLIIKLITRRLDLRLFAKGGKKKSYVSVGIVATGNYQFFFTIHVIIRNCVIRRVKKWLRRLQPRQEMIHKTKFERSR